MKTSTTVRQYVYLPPEVWQLLHQYMLANNQPTQSLALAQMITNTLEGTNDNTNRKH